MEAASSQGSAAARSRPGWALPVLVFLAAVACSVLAWQNYHRQEEALQQALMEQRLQRVVGVLVEEDRQRRQALERMVQRLAMAPNEQERERLFRLDSRLYLRDYGSFAAFLRIDASGTVTQLESRTARLAGMAQRRLLADPARQRDVPGVRRLDPAAVVEALRPLAGESADSLLIAGGPAGSEGVDVLAAVDLRLTPSTLLAGVVPTTPVRISQGGTVLFSRGDAVGPPVASRALDAVEPGLRVDLWPGPTNTVTDLLDELLLVAGILAGALLAIALRLWALTRLRAKRAEQVGRELREQMAEGERARTALGLAERELGAIFDSISDAFYTLDHDWRFGLVNPQAERMMRRTRAELVGQVVWEVFPETLGTEIEHKFRKAVAEQCTVSFEIYFPPLSTWFLARAYPHPNGLAVYFQDVGERKRAELGMLKAQATSERAQRLAQLGGWEYDIASGELRCSAQVLQILGVSPMRPPRSLPALLERVHFDDRARVQEAQRRLLAGDGDLDIEFRVLRPDGDILFVRDLGTVVKDEQGQPLLAAGAIQDISERRRTEDALRELTSRLEKSLVMNRLVMDNSLDVICVIDGNGRFSQVSAASLAVWGYPAHELVGRAYIDLVHPDDRGTSLRTGAQIRAGHPTKDFRNRYIARDGRVVAMQWSAVWSPRDQMMFAVARDITEGERQSRALVEAKESLQRAQQVARMGAWELDLGSRRLAWSDEVFRIFHVTPGEFAENVEAFAARVHPEDLARVEKAQARVLAGDGELDIQHRILLPDGAIGHVHQRARLLRNDQGAPWLLSGSVQDITDRVRAEVALEQEREFLRALLESLSEGIVACDADGHLTLFNRATREFHGLPQQALPAERWADHYRLLRPDGNTPLQPSEVPLVRALEGASIRNVEMVIVPRDQPPRVVLCNGEPIVSATGEKLGAVVAMHDVSEAKRAEQMDAGQRAILAGIAARRPLRESLEAITRLYEKQYPGALCSVLLLDEAGERVLTGAAPSLPETYNLAIHGTLIGEGVGSCGTSAWRGERVVVADIATDPLWRDYAALALEHGLRACWSTPVKSADGRVLATFATYYRQCREPLPLELVTTDNMAAMAAMAIEQDRAYRQLKLSEQRFRSLFDQHPDAVYSMDLEGRFTAFNDHFKALSNLGTESVVGQMFDERVAPEHRESVRAHFYAAAAGEARTYELTALTLAGDRFELRVTNLPIVVDGRVTGVFGIAHDISLLRKHQRELAAALDMAENNSLQLRRLSEAAMTLNRSIAQDDMYQQLVDKLRETLGAHQALISLNRNERFAQTIHAVSLSQKYARWRGFDAPSDGSGIYAIVGETNQPVRLTQAELEAHPRWRGFGAHAAHHPPMRGWLAVPLIANDGSNLGQLQLSDKVSGEFTPDDELIAVQFAQMASIAIERTELIEKLRVRDRFFDMSLEVFVIFDPVAQRFAQVNPVLSQLTGYSQEELCGRPFLDFLHPDDRAMAADRARRLRERDSVVNSYVNRYIGKDGTVRWLEWISVPAPDGLVYAVGRDITERQQAETVLRQTLVDLNNRNRELQDFAFIASHDLQEPLRKIRAFSDRLQQRHAAQLSPEARDYLDRSGQAAARMQTLIDDLLAYSRVAARGKPFAPVDLQALLGTVLDDLEARLESSGGRVEAGPLPTLEGDATQLRQMLQNLLANALKFRAPERAPVVRLSATATRLEGEPAWEIRVEDNGIGFEPKYADRIFGPFQRLHGRHEYEGTGIGLAIVRRIVERHRGSVRAEGRPGEGASFLLVLPERQPPVAGEPPSPMVEMDGRLE